VEPTFADPLNLLLLLRRKVIHLPNSTRNVLLLTRKPLRFQSSVEVGKARHVCGQILQMKKSWSQQHIALLAVPMTVGENQHFAGLKTRRSYRTSSLMDS